MKREILALVIMAIALITMSSCKVVVNNDEKDNGDKKEKYFKVNEFSKIENNGYADIKYISADSFGVKAVGTEKELAKVKISVANGKLIIDQDNDDEMVNINLTRSSRLTLYISAPTITSIELNGSGDFEAKKDFSTQGLNLQSEGSGDIAIHGVNCNGNIQLSLDGSGDFAAQIANAKTIHLNSNGSGDIAINCTACDNITGETNGSGDVVINGSVKSCNVQAHGSGDVVTNIKQDK